MTATVRPSLDSSLDTSLQQQAQVLNYPEPDIENGSWQVRNACRACPPTRSTPG